MKIFYCGLCDDHISRSSRAGACVASEQVAWRSMTDHRPVGDLAVQLAQESMCGG